MQTACHIQLKRRAHHQRGLRADLFSLCKHSVVVFSASLIAIFYLPTCGKQRHYNKMTRVMAQLSSSQFDS